MTSTKHLLNVVMGLNGEKLDAMLWSEIMDEYNRMEGFEGRKAVYEVKEDYSIDYTLHFPVSVEGVEVDSLHLNAPLGRDMLLRVGRHQRQRRNTFSA